MNEILKKLVDTAELYKKFLNEDLAIAISDKEKYIKVVETENLKFPFPEGEYIKNTGFDNVLQNIEKNRRVSS